MRITEHLRSLVRRDDPVGWRISAPFVFSVELGGEPDLALWQTIVSRIAPFATEIFFEAEGSLDHPAVPALLRCCDELGVRCHLTSSGMWTDARGVVGELRGLKHFGTLRLRIAGQERQLRNLAFAVAAGLEVWALLPLDEPQEMPQRVSQLHARGVRGVAFLRGTAGGDHSAESCRRIEELHQAGHNVMLEECAPAGCAVRVPGRCRGGLGSCVITAEGDVKACRHSPVVLGNLLREDIAAIWSSPQAESLRSPVAQAKGGLAGLYQHGCVFECAGAIGLDEVEVGGAAASLDPLLMPAPRYRIRSEPFGAVLIRGCDFVPVSRAGKRIAEAFDGRRTLQELQRRFGRRAVLLAYALFCEGMLRFSREAAPMSPQEPVDEEAEA